MATLDAGWRQAKGSLPHICLLKAGRCPSAQIVFVLNEENRSQEGWGQTSSLGTHVAPRVKEVRTVLQVLAKELCLKEWKLRSLSRACVPALGREKKTRKTSLVLLFEMGSAHLYREGQLLPGQSWGDPQGSFVTFESPTTVC